MYFRYSNIGLPGAVQPARVTVHAAAERGLPQRTVILIKFHAEVMAREKV